MTLAGWESAVRIAGFVVLGVAWAGAAAGAVSGAGRRAGRSIGLATRHRAHTVYVAGALIYFSICLVLWRPLPVSPASPARVALLICGASVGLGGAALYLLGRRELGSMYNVSSSLGSELYADHVLITSGPYAWSRHPMYLGLLLAALGGLMVYQTWTLVFMCCALVGAAIKARTEEHLLAMEFGLEWETYVAEVGWIPRLRQRTVKEETNDAHAAPG